MSDKLNDELSRETAEQLKKIMTARKLRNIDLSRMTGIGVAVITKMRNGRTVAPDSLLNILSALRMTHREFYNFGSRP